MTTFAQTYSQLMQLSADAPQDSFNSTEDYSKLDTLGPSLPKLPYPFPKGKDTKQAESVEVSLKSIKPPFRFSTTFTQIPLDQTIYKLKTKLVEDVASLKEARVTPASLKFMIKSKVLSDSTLLSAVAEAGLLPSITVMVSPPAPEPVEKADTDPEASAPVSISEEAWAKIAAVLQAEVGALDALGLVKKFRAAI